MNNFPAQSLAVRFMVICIGCVALVGGMYAIASILNPIFIAVLFAVLFDIPRAWLIRRGMSTGMALLITILITLLIAILFLILMGNTLLGLSATIPAYQQQIQTNLEKLGAMLTPYGIRGDQLKTLGQTNQTNPLNVITYVLSGVVSIFSGIILIMVYAIFLLIEVSGFPNKLNQAFDPSDAAYRYINKVTKNLRSFLVVQTKVSLITGVGVFIALKLLGVEFALLWAFVAFLMNFIPYIGSILAAVPAVIVAFIQFGPTATVLLVIAAYLLVNFVVNYAIYPRMMGQGVDLSMFIVLASMIFWGWVLGPIGLILAVPITSVIKISLESYSGSRWLGVMLGAGATSQVQSEGKPVRNSA